MAPAGRPPPEADDWLRPRFTGPPMAYRTRRQPWHRAQIPKVRGPVPSGLALNEQARPSEAPHGPRAHRHGSNRGESSRLPQPLARDAILTLSS